MLLPAVVLAAGLTIPAATIPLFRDVTAEAGIPPLRYSEGVNFIDLDGDLWPDLFLPVVKGGNRLFLNRGDGTFTDDSRRRGIVSSDGIGAVAADFDGDGRLDLYVARGHYPAGRSIVYRQRPDGTFEDVSTGSGVEGEGSHMTGVAGDWDRDGRVDLVAVNWGGSVLYRNVSATGRIRFEEVTESGLDGDGKAWSALLVDIDGDGWDDLAVARGTRGRIEPNRFYRGSAGSFEDRAAAAGIDRMGWSQGVVAADFDGDGTLDLFFTGFDGPGRLYVGAPGGTLRDASDGSGLSVAGSMGAVAGDVDNDLRPDLVVAGFDGGLRLFLNQGGGRFRDATVGSGLGAWNRNEGVALADMDRDGDLDLYVANYDGHNRLYRNESLPRKHLIVRPRTAGGVPAIGATGKLWRAGGIGRPEKLLARRDLLAGHGFSSQGPSELIFALPDDGPWDLTVSFPGGGTAEIRNVAPGGIDVSQPAGVK